METANKGRAAALMVEMEFLKRDIAAYSEATTVYVFLGWKPIQTNNIPFASEEDALIWPCPSQYYALPAAELCDGVVAALTRRMDTKRAQLRELGIEDGAPCGVIGE